MLSLQIILTYKSRLKYGNQKNSWKVSINCKTPVVVLVKPASDRGRSSRVKKGKWVFRSHCGSAAAKRQAGREFQPGDPGAPESCRALAESCLSPRTQQPSIGNLPSINLESSSDIFCLLIRGRLWGIGIPLSGLCLWSEQATEPLTFPLAEA